MPYQKEPASRLWRNITSLLKSEGVDVQGLSVARLAEVLQCSHGTAQRLRDGHENIRQATLQALAARFDTSMAILLDDGRSDDGARTGSPSDLSTAKNHGSIVITQWDVGGAMGAGLVLHDQPGEIHSWSVSSDWLTKNVRSYSSAANLCIVTGFGDSMRPVFNPGDPLLVDRGIKKVDADGMYFFRVGEEGFIKRLQRVPGEGIKVISANKDNYDPWTIKPDMDFEVLGRVIKVWRGEDF